jgi:hypothetical protein
MHALELSLAKALGDEIVISAIATFAYSENAERNNK